MKKYNIDDIDIFILTYNRCNYLIQTLTSLFEQTIKINRVFILDNGSTDETTKKIKNLNNKKILYKKSHVNKGVQWNFERAIDIAKSRYMMILHDDDLIHPTYFEHLLFTLNNFENLNLICSGMIRSDSPEKLNKYKIKYAPILLKTNVGVANLAYSGFPINFSSSLYLTSRLKNTKIESNKFNKFSDRPLIFKVIGEGNAVILPGKYLQYRIHTGQDSAIKNQNLEMNLINLHNRYYEILCNSSFQTKLTFYSNFKRYLAIESNQLSLDFNNYLEKTIDVLGISFKEKLFIDFLSFINFWLIYRLHRYCRILFGNYS